MISALATLPTVTSSFASERRPSSPWTRPDVVVYLGHNFDDSYCGSPQLFFYMTRRALLDEVVGRLITMLVLRKRLEETRPMTDEEALYSRRDQSGRSAHSPKNIAAGPRFFFFHKKVP